MNEFTVLRCYHHHYHQIHIHLLIVDATLVAFIVDVRLHKILLYDGNLNGWISEDYLEKNDCIVLKGLKFKR